MVQDLLNFVKLLIIETKMKKSFILILAALLLLCSCDGGTTQPSRGRTSGGGTSGGGGGGGTPVPADNTRPAREFTKAIMSQYYYWNKEIASKINTTPITSYSEVAPYFNALLYSGDRWSWMEDGESYAQSETGVLSGTWGASLDQASYNNDFRVRIAYLYPGSPFAKYGVTRGAVLKALGNTSLEPFTQAQLEYFSNNYNVSPQTFTFGLVDGRDTTFTTSWATSLKTSPVLMAGLLTSDEVKTTVGYLNYLSFKDNFEGELVNALVTLKNKGVKDLILDLRYNGGGSIGVLDTLISFLAPPSSAGQIYLTISHNSDIKDQLDSYYTVSSNSNNLNLNSLYVLTTKGTASASEVVINSLKPFLGSKLHTVGLTSYGKPNGMYVFLYPYDDASTAAYNRGNYSSLEYAIYPICFYDANKNGEFIPDTGFVPEFEVNDDLYTDFGPEEGMIAACLEHIATGKYPAATKAPSYSPQGRGVKVPFRPEEKDPHYGKSVCKPPVLK